MGHPGFLQLLHIWLAVNVISDKEDVAVTYRSQKSDYAVCEGVKKDMNLYRQFYGTTLMSGTIAAVFDPSCTA